jgi:hypothetical protein
MAWLGARFRSTRRQRAVDMAGIRHVSGDRQRLAAKLADGVRRCLNAGNVAVEQHKVGAGQGQREGHARPMAWALPVTMAVRPVRSNRFVMKSHDVTLRLKQPHAPLFAMVWLFQPICRRSRPLPDHRDKPNDDAER